MIKSFDTNILDGNAFTPALGNATTSSNGITITSLNGDAAGLAFNANETLDTTTTSITIDVYGTFEVDDSYLPEDFAVVLSNGGYVTGNFSDALSGVIGSDDLELGASVSTPETLRKYFLGYI